ncbi:MAG: hypothetical protein C0592_08380 [Marinilabiliales bacterium]|nr:MAG: hypothetical protein C0592_08380 [Marinilabiliales bacterium]
MDYYDIEVDTTLNFNSPMKRSATDAYINSSSSNSDTEEYFDNLLFGTKYYWRVRARNAVDTSGWSTVWYFTTRDYISLYSPSNGYTSAYTGYTLDWYAHTGVDYYDIEVDTTTNFNSPLLRTATDAYINSSSSNSDTEEYFDNLRFGTTYYWRVRARNSIDTSGWSTVWSFTTRDQITLYSPSNGYTSYTGYTFDWYAHAGVDFYDMELDTTPNFNSTMIRTVTETYINSNSSNNDTEEYFDNLLFGTTYYWRVRARNSIDTSQWSTVWTYNTRDDLTHYSPSNGSNSYAGLTLDWYAHAGVDYYDVEFDTSLTFSSPAKRTATNTYINSNSSNSDTEEYFDDIYFGETYFWRVRCRNAIDTSNWTNYWSVDIRDYVSLNSPANGATSISTSGINLDWYAHYGVDLYQMQLDTTNLFNSASLVTIDKAYINTSSSNSDTYQHTGVLLSNQVYWWRVRAINAVDTTAWTQRYFNTGSGTVLLPTTPTLSMPADGTTGVPTSVTLEWNPATNADLYFYEYADNPSFFSSVSAITADTFALVSGLSSSNTTYYWRVRAIAGTSIYSNYSATWDFTTGCSLPAPTVSSPSPLCDSGQVALTVMGSGMYHWYASDGVTLLHTGSTYNPPTIYSTDTFYVAEFDTVCEGPLAMVIVPVVQGPPVPTINQTGNTLYTIPGYIYQWYIAGTPVSGANGQFFDPPANGNYTVIITDSNGCTSESVPYYFTSTGISSGEELNARLYPNPANDVVYIEFDSEKEAIVRIFDLSGRQLSETEFPAQQRMAVDISYLNAGSYIVTCESDVTTVFRFNKL